MEIRELIYNEYLKNPNLSSREIGKILGCTRDKVCYHLKKLGIKRDRETLRKLNNTNRSKNIEISEKADQIILGSILGDGSITKHIDKDHNSRLSITHGVKQHSYLLYKAQLLKNENIPLRISYRKPGKKHFIKGWEVKENGTYYLETCQCAQLNKYRDMFYRDKKFINRYVYKLNPLGLAIWYMDDGYYHKGFYLCTNCFTKKDVSLLQDMLLHNFNIEKKKTKTVIGGIMIYVRAKSAKIFKDLITPYVIPEMIYKLGS